MDRLLHRDVNFREFYFSIREFQISRLVEYSKLTRHSAWTTHLMRECCNTVNITPRSCGWAANPGKWSDGREVVAVSNYKARLSLSCARVLSDSKDRLLSSQTYHTYAVPTMNSPSHADRLGCVYSLANLNWFRMQC